MNDARAQLRRLHAAALPVFDVAARGRVYRVSAPDAIRAIQAGMQRYSDEFGAHVGSQYWTARQLTHR